jgi:hypothetical protein
MRCATPVTIYAFTGTGTTRGTYAGLTVGAEGATCTTAQYAVLSAAELDSYLVSPFKLSLAEAGAFVTAVLGVWAVGYGFRMVIRLVRSSEINEVVNE